MNIRPIEPSDRHLLAAGFQRLSPESRYRRFFAAIPRLTERQLDYLTQIDHRDHEALIAIDEETGEAIGVARYVRTGPGVAEPAVVVVDHWHGRGVASALLDRLVERAIEEGVERFVAPVLADNVGAIRTLERLGETTAEQRGGEVELTIELRRAEPAAASAPRRLLRDVAAGAIEPALTIWHRIVPRRGLPRERLDDVVVAGVQQGDEGAAELAADIALARGWRVVVVAARRPLAGPEDDPEPVAARLRARGADAEHVLDRGDLAALLLDTAIRTRARLIVVPDTGGDEQVSGRLLGSVWDHVSHHSPCDVLVSRTRPPGGPPPRAPADRSPR